MRPFARFLPCSMAMLALVFGACRDGLTALAEDACYVLPPSHAAHEGDLLIYLHGIVPPFPSPQKDRVQNIVKNASIRAGWTALLPRGRRGIGPAQNRDWWAWPT